MYNINHIANKSHHYNFLVECLFQTISSRERRLPKTKTKPNSWIHPMICILSKCNGLFLGPRLPSPLNLKKISAAIFFAQSCLLRDNYRKLKISAPSQRKQWEKKGFVVVYVVCYLCHSEDISTYRQTNTHTFIHSVSPQMSGRKIRGFITLYKSVQENVMFHC